MGLWSAVFGGGGGRCEMTVPGFTPPGGCTRRATHSALFAPPNPPGWDRPFEVCMPCLNEIGSQGTYIRRL